MDWNKYIPFHSWLIQSDPKLTSGMVQKLLSNLHDKQDR